MDNEIFNTALKAFFGKDPLEGQRAVEFFLEHGTSSIEYLLASADSCSPQVEIRLRKLSSGLGEEVIPFLIRAIKDGDWHSKLIASPCFAGFKGSNWAKTELTKILEAGEIDQQRIAIEALGYLGAHDLAFYLVEFAQTGTWLKEVSSIFGHKHIDKYSLDKFHHFVLQALIRMCAATTNKDDIARCLDFVVEFLPVCQEHLPGNKSYDWDLRFVLHHLGPQAEPTIIAKWIGSENSIIEHAGFEALGRLKLTRTARFLAEIICNHNKSSNARSFAGVALSNFASPHAARILANCLQQGHITDAAVHWPLSTMYGINIEWPDCTDIIASILSTNDEVAAQMRYSLALRKQYNPENIIALLDSSTGFIRGAAALTLARQLGEQSLQYLNSRESEAEDSHEQIMFLAAQIHAGKIEQVQKLHSALQLFPSLTLLRDIWKREVLSALMIGKDGNTEMAKLWCEAAHTSADQVCFELQVLIGDDKTIPEIVPDDSIVTMKMEPVSVAKEKHAVLLIHGIRTQAEWQQSVAHAIESNSTIKVIPTRYEFLDVIRFLIPMKIFRQEPVNRIAQIIRDEAKRTKDISIIAHSFGTFIVSELLENHPDIDFHRIILCGSIVRDDFPWTKYSARIAQGENLDWQVVNDCGMRDIWPVMAKSMTWGYGSSGRFGFGCNRVRDRFHQKGHGDFFTKDFVLNFWLPYINGKEVVPGEIERVPNSWWISILTVVQIKYLVILLLLLAVIIH